MPDNNFQEVYRLLGKPLSLLSFEAMGDVDPKVAELFEAVYHAQSLAAELGWDDLEWDTVA